MKEELKSQDSMISILKFKVNVGCRPYHDADLKTHGRFGVE